MALARGGKVEAVMKGSLHTDELMHEVVAKDTGLRTARRISHVFALDVPAYPRPLFLTDAAINIAPDLEDKRDIVQNAIDMARALSIETPKVAILSFVETVDAKFRSTTDAAALCKMADRKQITGGLVDGPLAFDNAVSEEAARAKGIDSAVAGRADILVVPDIEAGNMLAKQLEYLAEAQGAGIVLGARVPIALTSRADKPMSGWRPARSPCSWHARRKVSEHDTRHPGAQRRLVERQVLGLLGRRGRPPTVVPRGDFEGIGTAPHFFAGDAAGATIAEERLPPSDDRDAGRRRASSLRLVKAHGEGLDVMAVGHRVVHGGPVYAEPVIVDERVLEVLTGFEPLAPAHQPHNLAPIRAGQGPARSAPGGLLRHGVPPDSAAGRRAVCAAAHILRRRRAPLWLPRPVVRVRHPRPAGWTPSPRRGGWWSPTWATDAAWRPSGRARASATRWASRGWTACPWARGAARSTRAF